MNDEMSSAVEIVDQGPGSVMVEAEKQASAQRIQAALVIAQKFKRNELQAEKRILEACQRFDLAEKAFYAFPRGGESVKGLTIRVTEMMARYWGNLKYGIRELEQGEGRSIVESFCWDLETNVEVTRAFTVQHRIKLKSGAMKELTDPRDVYEMVANQGQRRVRACILEIIPEHIVETVKDQIHSTLKAGDKKMSFADRLRQMVLLFSGLGVTQEHIEKRIGHPIAECNVDEVVELSAVYRSIKEGEYGREKWFDFKNATEGGKAQETAAKFTGKNVAEK